MDKHIVSLSEHSHRTLLHDVRTSLGFHARPVLPPRHCLGAEQGVPCPCFPDGSDGIRGDALGDHRLDPHHVVCSPQCDAQSTVRLSDRAAPHHGLAVHPRDDLGHSLCNHSRIRDASRSPCPHVVYHRIRRETFLGGGQGHQHGARRGHPLNGGNPTSGHGLCRLAPSQSRLDRDFDLPVGLSLSGRNGPGLFRGGGMGWYLKQTVETLDNLRVSAILLSIIMLVIVSEGLSAWARKRISGK
jgi:hypothetical protein